MWINVLKIGDSLLAHVYVRFLYLMFVITNTLHKQGIVESSKSDYSLCLKLNAASTMFKCRSNRDGFKN